MPPISSESASRRRQTRLRREYLYRKSLEGREKAEYEQKRLVRQALAAGTALPTEVRASYDKLKPQIDAEDTRTEDGWSHACASPPVAILRRALHISPRNSVFCFQIALD
jgi:U3 small nucleolar ribonucleoprotein protein IMP4